MLCLSSIDDGFCQFQLQCLTSRVTVSVESHFPSYAVTVLLSLSSWSCSCSRRKEEKREIKVSNLESLESSSGNLFFGNNNRRRKRSQFTSFLLVSRVFTLNSLLLHFLKLCVFSAVFSLHWLWNHPVNQSGRQGLHRKEGFGRQELPSLNNIWVQCIHYTLERNYVRKQSTATSYCKYNQEYWGDSSRFMLICHFVSHTTTLEETSLARTS